MSMARLDPGDSIEQATGVAGALLASAGIASARLEARLLMGLALGLDAEALLARGRERLGTFALARLQGLLAERLAGRPFAHIAGRREFWSLDLRAGPEALVPRPDSETLIEAVLALRRDLEAPLKVLDLGTGTGCLLLAILSEYRHAEGLAVDLSEPAARLARANAAALGLLGRMRIIVGDWAAAVGGRFDIVLANPPYIPSAALTRLEPEVREHEPRLALDGGPDGLAPARAVLAASSLVLERGGLLVLEHGADQREAVLALAAAEEALRPRLLCEDLALRPRVAVFERT